MDDARLTAYDDFPYRSGIREATHPDRLAVIGRVLGLGTADPGSCRVLELGCGDGGNLIPLALVLPGSHFVGIDLAPTAIERAREAANAVGAQNIELIQRDIAEAGDELGMFDYIVAHGVYSWVPEAVRERILAVIRACLAPEGVAFVSYNALPGTQIRHVLREMMLRHTAGITDPVRRIEQARGLLAMLAISDGDSADTVRPVLQAEAARALDYTDWLLLHDDLAAINVPFYFSDFVADARRHGLQFVAEASFHEMSLDGLPEALAETLAKLGARDRILQEQYLDYVRCRSFRQTLLCHAERALRPQVNTAFIRQFRFSSQAQPADDSPGDDGLVAFAHPNRATLRTSNALGGAVLRSLAARYPQSVPFPDLAAGAGPEDEEALAEILFRAFAAGVIEMHLYEPAATFEVSERPVASPWARRRAESGRVPNLYHDALEADDDSRALLALLDGSHTLPELAVALGWDEPRTYAEALELARHGLLVATP